MVFSWFGFFRDAAALPPLDATTLDGIAAALRDVRRDQAAGAIPVAELELAVSAAQKSGDNQTYFEFLQTLLVASPTSDVWNAAIALVQAEPAFPDGLTLDAERLRLATGTLTQAGDYEDYALNPVTNADVATSNSFSGNITVNAGVLTAQTDAGHATRLQNLANNQAAQPQNANVTPTTLLDADIAAGRGFTNIPGYTKGDLNNPQAALARLWQIEVSATQK